MKSHLLRRAHVNGFPWKRGFYVQHSLRLGSLLRHFLVGEFRRRIVRRYFSENIYLLKQIIIIIPKLIPLTSVWIPKSLRLIIFLFLGELEELECIAVGKTEPLIDFWRSFFDIWRSFVTFFSALWSPLELFLEFCISSGRLFFNFLRPLGIRFCDFCMFSEIAFFDFSSWSKDCDREISGSLPKEKVTKITMWKQTWLYVRRE